MADIAAARFACWEVSPDGAEIRMTVEDAAGARTGVVLPAEALNGLVLTLPAVIERSLRRQHRDPTLKLVYPLAGWSVEQAAGTAHLIVTLESPDGFKVSFVASPEELDGIGDTARAGAPPPKALN